jgi:hypothetical protein
MRRILPPTVIALRVVVYAVSSQVRVAEWQTR